MVKHKEQQRVTDLFLKSRNFAGLEFFNLALQMSLKDWNNVRNDDWYFKSKHEKLRIIQNYLRDKRYGK